MWELLKELCFTSSSCSLDNLHLSIETIMHSVNQKLTELEQHRTLRITNPFKMVTENVTMHVENVVVR